MKAAYLTGHGGNEIVAVGERPQPVRRAGEVLVRLRAATVNRVDLYMRDSGAGITHTLPMIMGLDGAGVVEEIDAEERMLRAGQQVLLHPGIACGRCEFCVAGQPVLCELGKVQATTGGLPDDGTTRLRLDGREVHHLMGVSCFAEQVVVSEKSVVHVPDGSSTLLGW